MATDYTIPKEEYRALVAKLNEMRLDMSNLMSENAKLRELCADMWSEGMCECGSLGKCANCIYDYPSRMRELGIELNDYE